MIHRFKLRWVTVLLIGLLALVGCGVLDVAQDEQAIAATEANTVQISQAVAQQSTLEAELASLRAQVAELSGELDVQGSVINEIDSEDSAEIVQIQNDDTPAAIPSSTMGLDLQNSLTALYDNVNPSVVFIVVGTTQGLGGSGSGFVYDADGHIVTNNHVVANAANIEVVFADGTRSDAELIGTDVDSDLAVIRAETLASDARPLPLSSMAAVDVGQFAVAIGNPFGEQGSMSLGIISGLGRSLTSQRVLDGTGGSYQLPQVIQTDAPINPGNSGGPLLNLNGEVIGVNSAIRTETGENSGVGFSIPVDAVNNIVPELIAEGEYTYPYLGLSFIREEAKVRIIEQMGIEGSFGAYVGSAATGGPAASAGIQGADATGFGGDLIIALDGSVIKDFDDLNAYLVFNTKPEQEIDATVIRDGEEIVIPIVLGARP